MGLGVQWGGGGHVEPPRVMGRSAGEEDGVLCARRGGDSDMQLRPSSLVGEEWPEREASLHTAAGLFRQRS